MYIYSAFPDISRTFLGQVLSSWVTEEDGTIMKNQNKRDHVSCFGRMGESHGIYKI